MSSPQHDLDIQYIVSVEYSLFSTFFLMLSAQLVGAPQLHVLHNSIDHIGE